MFTICRVAATHDYDSEWIRTTDLQIRNLMLYPAELRNQIRRGWDSNPRYPVRAQLLSREPDSATLAPLQCAVVCRGESGIRTHGTLRFNGFQDRLFRPLRHLSDSERAINIYFGILSVNASRV